jgi:hypothetical protein
MLYFDSRSVSRIYQMSLSAGVWKLWREAPSFAQRFEGTLLPNALYPRTTVLPKVALQPDLRLVERHTIVGIVAGGFDLVMWRSHPWLPKVATPVRNFLKSFLMHWRS